MDPKFRNSVACRVLQLYLGSTRPEVANAPLVHRLVTIDLQRDLHDVDRFFVQLCGVYGMIVFIPSINFSGKTVTAHI